MATGQNTSLTTKRSVIKAVRSLRQKVHYFKWKLWKYQDSSDTYFMERNYEMVDICDQNAEAFKKAVMAARRTLQSLEIKLESM